MSLCHAHGILRLAAPYYLRDSRVAETHGAHRSSKGGPTMSPRAVRSRRCVRSRALALAVGIAAGGLAVIGSAGISAAAGTPTFVQGTVLTNGSRSPSMAITLTGAVASGDLLVGWFADYNAPGLQSVSDNVNGAWMRAPGALTFQNDSGDIALFYL